MQSQEMSFSWVVDIHFYCWPIAINEKNQFWCFRVGIWWPLGGPKQAMAPPFENFEL